MALVTAFQIDGLKIWFWSNDHEPPHFHVMRRANWEVKVSFMLDPAKMIEIQWGSPSQSELKALIRLAEKHRLDLLEQWRLIRESETSKQK